MTAWKLTSMARMVRIWRASGAAGVVLAMALAGTAAAADQLAIGVAGPMTGRYAGFGTEMKAGAQLAIEDLNAAGGVLGRQLVLEIEDDACSREAATAAARRLVDRRVHVVIGHYCAAASYSAAGVYRSAGVVHIAPTASSAWPADAPTNGTPVSAVFHLSSGQPQGEVAGRYLAARPGWRVAILHDRTTYGAALAEDVRDTMRKTGREEVLFAHVRAGEKDYSAIVDKLKATGVDAVYFGGFPTEAAIIVRQLRQAGLSDVALFAGDALATNDFWQLADAAGEGSLLTFSYDASRHPRAADVVQRLQSRELERTSDAVRVYAAVQIWAQSVAAQQRTEAAAVANQISAGADTILGSVTFDANRRANVPSFAIHVWTRGKLEQLD